MMRRVAIIGMGVAGAAVLLAYGKKYSMQEPKDLRIDCFDEPETFGRGVPFSEQSPEALINSRSFKISFDYENLTEFHEWLQKNHSDDAPADYVPRSLYGDYSYERTMDLIEKLGANPIYSKVSAVDHIEETGQWMVKYTDSNESSETIYDEVHICVGVEGYIDPYDLKGEANYLHYPYPLDKVCQPIDKADSVVIIGTGLTAIDCAKHLLNQNGIRDVSMFSRSNFFPTVRGDDLVELDFQHLTYEVVNEAKVSNNGKFTFDAFDSLFNKEVNHLDIDYPYFKEKQMAPGEQGMRNGLKNRDQFGMMASLMNRVSEIMTIGWEAMPLDDRKQFDEVYQKVVELTRNPMPDTSAEELISFIDEGKLHILDNAKKIEVAPQGGFILSNEDKEKVKKADWVLNATGLDMNFQDLNEFPLHQQLLNDRYTQVDQAGGYSIVRKAASLISPRYGQWNNLYAHGLIVNGPIYQNNASIKIQQHADMLIRRTPELVAFDI